MAAKPTKKTKKTASKVTSSNLPDPPLMMGLDYRFPEIEVRGPIMLLEKERERRRKSITDSSDWVVDTLGIDVQTLASLTPVQAVRLFGSSFLYDQTRACVRLPPQPIVCHLDYPLEHEAYVRVHPYQHGAWMRSEPKLCVVMEVDWLLWCLAKAYESVYAHASQYGVWGHALRDLCFETLYIAGQNAWVSVGR